MASSFPDKYLDLFQKKAFAAFTTLMPDGSPQTTPVWVDYQNNEIWVNSAVGRQKDRNVRRDPRVALAVIDSENPYRYLFRLVYCRERLSPRDVARFLHTRKSAITFMVAPRTSAQTAAFDIVSIVPSTSMPWTTLPTTMTTARDI